MSEHDRTRYEQALQCDLTSIASVEEAVRGLQSTDDPILVPLHDALMQTLTTLRREQDNRIADRMEAQAVMAEMNETDNQEE